MKCNDVMAFLSQISAKSVDSLIPEEDLNFLIDSGFVGCLSKDEYEKLKASVADISKASGELGELQAKESADEEVLVHDQKKTHSIRFWFEGRERKEADRGRVQTDEQSVSKDEEMIRDKGSELQSLIQKKSILDRQASYGERFLSLTGAGVAVLHDLTARSDRVGDKDFKAFMKENKATDIALQSIAERAAHYYTALKAATANMDKSPLAKSEEARNDDDEDEEENEDDYRIKTKGAESSQLWAIAIGLAKLEGDPDKIEESYVRTVNSLSDFRSQFCNANLDSKLGAAETLVVSGHAEDPQLLESLTAIDRQIRQSANVPEELSAGISTTIYCGANPDALKRFTGTDGYPIFSRMTKSYMAAALLSSSQENPDDLQQKFESFKSMFDTWGYSSSEDTDLAAAYLSLSRLSEDDAREKMNSLVDALKTEFEFPLVPSAILASMPLSAPELLDLAEKAATILQSQTLTTGLSHVELANLAIRMIYGQGW